MSATVIELRPRAERVRQPGETANETALAYITMLKEQLHGPDAIVLQFGHRLSANAIRNVMRSASTHENHKQTADPTEVARQREALHATAGGMNP